MFFGGRIMERIGPRLLALGGGLIVGLGWILSSFATSIWMLVLTYGVIAGSGVGLVYGCPVAMRARWFPDRKGLAVGLMLAGFGGSAGAADGDIDGARMLKTHTFWGLFLCYTIGCLAGLMAIGISKPVGSDLIKIASGTATSLVGVFALFNAVGRPLFGWLAIAPAATATFFGMTHSSRNYGTVFFAYGLGAILGGIISGHAQDWFGSYTYAFVPTATLAAVGIAIALVFLDRPTARISNPAA